MYIVYIIISQSLSSGLTGPVLYSGQEFTVWTPRAGYILKGLDKFLLLSGVTQTRIEVRGCEAEESLVLVRSAEV